MPANDTYARFYIHPSLIKGKKGTDNAEYKDILFTEIFIKGSTNTSFGRPKIDDDETKYSTEWNAYQNNETVNNTGTNITALPTIGPAAQMNLAAKGINTVEDLAELDDQFVIGEPGMLELRKRAQAYIEALKPEQAEERQREIEAKETAQADRMREMQEEIDRLKAIGSAIKVIDDAIPEDGVTVREPSGALKKRTRRKRNEAGELV